MFFKVFFQKHSHFQQKKAGADAPAKVSDQTA
jgi:hypothetical protein